MDQSKNFSADQARLSSAQQGNEKRRKPSVSLLFLTAILTLGMGGCAVHTDANNRTTFAIDHAAVFGIQHARFNLQDGSEGSLRSIGDDYSLKLEKFFKVIPLGKAQQAQLQQAYQIKDRTVLIINMQENSGCMKTVVLAIKDAQVLQWVLTPQDCISLPVVLATAEQLQLGYPMARYLYENDSLVEEKPKEVFAPPPPSKSPSTRTAPQNKARAAQRKKTPAGTPATRQSDRVNTPNAPAPKAPPDLRFNRSGEEQKPVIINLE